MWEGVKDYEDFCILPHHCQSPAQNLSVTTYFMTWSIVNSAPKISNTNTFSPSFIFHLNLLFYFSSTCWASSSSHCDMNYVLHFYSFIPLCSHPYLLLYMLFPFLTLNLSSILLKSSFFFWLSLYFYQSLRCFVITPVHIATFIYFYFCTPTV